MLGNPKDIDEFLDACGLSKLNQNDIKNLNRSIMSIKIEVATKKKKVENQIGPLQNSTRLQRTNTNLSQTSQ